MKRNLLRAIIRAAVTEAAHRSGRRFVEEGYTGHAQDHPATFDEARYLKAAYLRFEPPTR